MSKPKVTNLSEIKMKNENRERKGIVDQLKNLPTIVNERDVTGYAIVMFHRDGGASAFWDTSSLGHLSIVRSEMVKRVMDRVEAQHDMEDMIDDLFDE